MESLCFPPVELSPLDSGREVDTRRRRRQAPANPREVGSAVTNETDRRTGGGSQPASEWLTRSTAYPRPLSARTISMEFRSAWFRKVSAPGRKARPQMAARGRTAGPSARAARARGARGVTGAAPRAASPLSSGARIAAGKPAVRGRQPGWSRQASACVGRGEPHQPKRRPGSEVLLRHDNGVARQNEVHQLDLDLDLLALDDADNLMRLVAPRSVTPPASESA